MTSLNDEDAPDSLVQKPANDSGVSGTLDLEADVSVAAVHRQSSQNELVVGERVPVGGGGPGISYELREARELVAFQRWEWKIGPEESIAVHQVHDVASCPRGDHGGEMWLVFDDALLAMRISLRHHRYE